MPTKTNLNDPIQARINENKITIKKSKMRLFRSRLNSIHPLTIAKKNNTVTFLTTTTRTMPSKH